MAIPTNARVAFEEGNVVVSEFLRFKKPDGRKACEKFAAAFQPMLEKAGGEVVLSVRAEMPIVSEDLLGVGQCVLGGTPHHLVHWLLRECGDLVDRPPGEHARLGLHGRVCDRQRNHDLRGEVPWLRPAHRHGEPLDPGKEFPEGCPAVAREPLLT